MANVWEQLICQTCGSNAVEIVDGLLCCKVCKSKHTLQEKVSEEEVIALNVATTDRNAYKFEDALEKYEQLLKKYPDNEAANWGALLADYGIAYVKDYDGKFIPTCHRLNERPISVCSYYYKLNADHKVRAKEIEKLRIAIMDKAKKIQPYDVFICYKATEDMYGKSVQTKEAGWAREIYTMLKHKLNLRVFFAEESLTGENSEWEPHIYKALNTAKLMFVLTTGIENVNSTWVKNEWKRYSRYIKEGQDKTIRVVYDIMNAYDLPKELQNTQAIPHNSMSWGEAVRKAAESIFAVKEEVNVKKNNKNASVAAVEVDKPKIDKYCAYCGAGKSKEIKFCQTCGHNIFAPEFKKYCTDCGTETSLLEHYCANCGKKNFVYTKEDYEALVEQRHRDEENEKELNRRRAIWRREEEKKEAGRWWGRVILSLILNAVQIIMVLILKDELKPCGVSLESCWSKENVAIASIILLGLDVLINLLFVLFVAIKVEEGERVGALFFRIGTQIASLIIPQIYDFRASIFVILAVIAVSVLYGIQVNAQKK